MKVKFSDDGARNVGNFLSSDTADSPRIFWYKFAYFLLSMPSILKMKPVRFPETSVSFFRSTRHHILEATAALTLFPIYYVQGCTAGKGNDNLVSRAFLG
jgi:hypothetical protein